MPLSLPVMVFAAQDVVSGHRLLWHVGVGEHEHAVPGAARNRVAADRIAAGAAPDAEAEEIADDRVVRNRVGICRPTGQFKDADADGAWIAARTDECPLKLIRFPITVLPEPFVMKMPPKLKPVTLRLSTAQPFAVDPQPVDTRVEGPRQSPGVAAV